MARIEYLRPSEDKKFLKESIEDYHSLCNYLLRNHSEILMESQKLLGRPIKTGLSLRSIKLKG